jgi:hypothetical protein
MLCGAHLFVLSNDEQAGLEPAGGPWWWWQQWQQQPQEMASNVLSVTWLGEAMHGLGVQDV